MNDHFDNTPNFGTDPHKLHRANATDTSIEAAYAVDTTRLEEIVLTAIRRFGPGGAIQDDILRRFPQHPYSSITARFKALLDKGLIVDSGERRKGRSGRSQRILIAAG